MTGTGPERAHTGPTDERLKAILARHRSVVPVVIALGLLASLLEGIGVAALVPLTGLVMGQAPGEMPGIFADVAQMAQDRFGEHAAYAVAALVLLCLLAKAVLLAVNNIHIVHVRRRVGVDVMQVLTRKVLNLHMAGFMRDRPSRFYHLLTTECQQLDDVVEAGLVALQAAASLSVIGLILLWLQWQLFAVTLLSGLIALAIIAVLELLQARQSRRWVGENKALSHRLTEVIDGRRTIRIFGLERFEEARIQQAVETLARRVFRIRVLKSLVRPMLEIVIAVMFFAALFSASRMGLGLGVTIAFIVLLTRAQPYANAISVARSEISSRTGSIAEVNWLLAQPEESARADDVTAPAAAPAPSSESAIRFEAVGYRYPDGSPALSGASFTIEPGTSVALLGKSGSGKSTVVDLVCRLIEPTAGRLLAGGTELAEHDLAQWRSRIAIAGQDIFLFEGSVAENIALGRPTASRAEIEEVASAAGLEPVLAGLSAGLDTFIATGGQSLSGGQRQRVGLARALLRRPQILILDEATNAIDASTEEAIMAILAERRTLFGTAIVISHRRATVARCEYGIVLEEGRVAEAGRLDELAYLRTMAGARE